jgi:predicted acyltransferase
MRTAYQAATLSHPDTRTKIAPGVTSARPVSPRRLQSLDVLRGLTVAGMILVNTSGDGAHTFPILAHSRWNGCTFADVIFPCFLFMIGISGVISASRRLNRSATRGAILRSALRRSAILFALGLLVNTFPTFHLHTLRIFGVLQRIALCYLAATALFLWTRTRTLAIATVAILLGYWVLLRWARVPGAGMPVRDLPLLDPHNNLPAWLDRHLLPAAHLYHQGFYDPEGLLSTLPAIASTLIGTLTGLWLQGKRSHAQTARNLLIAALLSLTYGLAWSLWLPFNKRLWTSSYVVWTGGINLLALWAVFVLLDVRKAAARWFYPAVVFGMNALAAYIFSELFASLLGAVRLSSGLSLQKWLYQPLAAYIPDPSIAALSYATLFVAACFVPPWLLYRRRIFLKV